MEHRDQGGSGQPDGRLVRFAGGRGALVRTDSGKKLGRVDWFVIDPLAGRIALVMIGSKRFGLFRHRQVAVPWSAVGIDEKGGSLVVRTEDGAAAVRGDRFTSGVRRDPARVE